MELNKLNTQLFEVCHISESDIQETFTIGKPSGNGVVRYYKLMAMNEEQEGKARTYIVKDISDREIVAYFTLKTGMMTERTGLLIHDNCSAIEIANFAINDSYKINHPEVTDELEHIGKYIFSQFIIPIVKEIQSLVGAKYLQIYALPEKSLIAHYEGMGFSRTSNKVERYIHRHIKPLYDKGCIFYVSGNIIFFI